MAPKSTIPTAQVLTLLDLPPESMTQAQAAAWHQLCCCLYTGMRSAELAALTWSRVNFEAGFLDVVSPKSHRMRRIPLHAALAAHLQRWRAQCPQAVGEQPVFCSAGRGGTMALFRRAGLPLSGGLSLARLTFVREAARQGLSLEALKQILGYPSKPQPELRPLSVAAALGHFKWKQADTGAALQPGDSTAAPQPR